MEFVTGDYISKVWIFTVNESALTVVSVFRRLLFAWEVTMTWDKPPSPGSKIYCDTTINRLILPHTFTEQQINEHVESVVCNYELHGSCKRVADIEVYSDDPQVFIDKFFEVAQQSERISCSFIRRDLPPTKV